MGLRLLRATSLRCLEQTELELHAQLNYIFGPNGAGKTSLLESAYLLGRGRSFRTRQIGKLVRKGTTGFAVYGEVEGLQAHRLGVGIENGRLLKKLDGLPAGMVELARALPIHAVHPGLHHLIEGGPSERRRFLDWGVFHVEPHYVAAWRQYRRVLGQRNAALKAGSVVELRSWTAALAESGRSIDEYRSGYVERLAAAAENIGRDLLGAAVRLEYRRGWPQDQTLEGALGAGEASDRSVGTTQVGPHRADLRVLLDARGVRDEASRGQQKLVATTLVLAQVRVQQSGEDERSSSVVLVDDPAAELDRERLERLLDALGALRAQLIVTGLSAETLPPRSGFPVFHVERGNVKPL